MLEKVLWFSIRHRWLMVLVTIAGAAVGIAALQKLPIDAVPDITGVQVVVTTTLSGLGPEEVEKQVTFPIESALSGTPGLTGTRSLSRNGFSQVTANFADDVDIYFARQQVSERLLEAKESLPPGADPRLGSVSSGLSNVYLWALDFEKPPPAAPASQPARSASPIDAAAESDGDGEEAVPPGWQPDGSYVTTDGERLTSEVDRLTYLRTVQDWIVRPQIKQLPGVADVDVQGGHVKQYVVQPNPSKLVQYGVTFGDLATALERGNAAAGGNYISRGGEASLVRIDARLKNLEQIGEVPLRAVGGTLLRVRDVAEVTVGHDVRTGASSLNGHEVVGGIAMMLTGSNSRTVAAAVHERLQTINLPPGVRIVTVLNRQTLVNSTIRTVGYNLVEGALLVVAVLLLLLGNLRAALLTALSIPLSMLLTASGMVAFKVSGNLMSLGAIDFGLIVDGAVIIADNCLRVLAERQVELGRTLTSAERLDAVYAGSRQVRTATAFGEAIIVIVYLPILTLAGVEGKMFRPMALTVVFALAAAFVLSLTFVPAMVAIVLRGRIREKENVLVRATRRLYEPCLNASLRLRWVVTGVALVLVVIAVVGFGQLGRVFIPRLDEGDVNVISSRIPRTSLDEALVLQTEMETTLRQVPEVENVMSSTGTGDAAQDPIPQFEADMFVSFKPQNQWRSEVEIDKALAERETQLREAGLLKAAPTAPTSEADEDEALGFDRKAKLVRLLKLELTRVPATGYEMSQPIEDRFSEMIAGVRSDVAVEVYGEDYGVMRPLADQVAATLRRVPGAADIKVETTDGLPVVEVNVDRPALSRIGVPAGDVVDLVKTAVGGRPAGVINEGDKRFDIVVRLPESLRNDVDALGRLPLPLPAAAERLAAAAKGAGLGQTSGRAGGGSSGRSADDRPGVVSLASVAKIKPGTQQFEVTRENGKRHVIVQCNVRGRDLGSFVDEARQKVAAVVHPPAGTWLEWGGQFQTYAAARQRLAVVVPVALFLIFTLLYASFGSVRDALLVFSGVPMALTGGVAALLIREMPFSISAGVGFIALSGVAVLNGLVMVSFIKHLRGEGVSLTEAIRRGSLTRLRAVLTTALVAAVGFLPMALATGSGAEVQRPLATVVVGGVVSCTLLTLVVLPALYRLAHRERRV